MANWAQQSSNAAGNRATKFGAMNLTGQAKGLQIGVLNAGNFVVGSDTSSNGGSGQPRFISNIPYGVVGSYVDRPALSKRIRDQLQGPARGSTPGKAAVVQGMGGAGKTQLALQYAERHRSEYNGVFWLSLVSQQSVDQELRRIYRVMYRSSGKEPQEFNELLIMVKNWFAAQKGKYLWLLDNADNVEDPRDQDYVNLMQLIPQDQQVHTIITTRSTKVTDLTGTSAIVVEGMEPQQALELFWKISKIQKPSTQNTNVAKRLLSDFDYLALAITMAGAAVAESVSMSQNLQKYVDLYNTNKMELLARYPNQMTTPYNTTIRTSWETSYLIISRRSPLAARLLGLISLFSPNDIAPSHFETVLSIRNSQMSSSLKQAKWQSVLGYHQQDMDFRSLEVALSTLASFSLLKYTNIRETYIMHKLIHEWGYERLGSPDRFSYGQSACVVHSLLVLHYNDKPEKRSHLCDHVMRNFSKTSRINLRGESEWFIHQWDQQGKFLEFEKSWRNCETVRSYILRKREASNGPDHEHTINAKNNLAMTLGQRLKHTEATAMILDVISTRTRLRGPYDPQTVAALNNYAGILKGQHKYDEALAIQKQVLEKRKMIYKPDDPILLATRNNLASQMTDMGKLNEALPILREVAEQRRRVLGADDVDTISSFYNMGVTLAKMNQADEATTILREVMERRKKTLGKRHQDTVNAMCQLAVSLGNQAKLGKHDKLKEAATVLEQVLEIQKKDLGARHPQTKQTEQNLGLIKKNTEAVRANEEAARKAREAAKRREAARIAQPVNKAPAAGKPQASNKNQAATTNKSVGAGIRLGRTPKK